MGIAFKEKLMNLLGIMTYPPGFLRHQPLVQYTAWWKGVVVSLEKPPACRGKERKE